MQRINPGDKLGQLYECFHEEWCPEAYYADEYDRCGDKASVWKAEEASCRADCTCHFQCQVRTSARSASASTRP